MVLILMSNFAANLLTLPWLGKIFDEDESIICCGGIHYLSATWSVALGGVVGVGFFFYCFIPTVIKDVCSTTITTDSTINSY